MIDADLRDAGAGLSGTLEILRGAGVRILWVLGSAEDAKTAPSFLANAGFAAGDGLVVPEAVTRRRQYARQLATIKNCVVAIAGRRRGDMDELYDYLKNPDTLVPSDILWNRGWFLIPAPTAPSPVSKGNP